VTSFLLWRDLDLAQAQSLVRTLLFFPGVSISSTRARTAFLRALRERLRPFHNDIALTERERRILSDLLCGMTREQIAQAEGISLPTVKRTISKLQDKLDAPSQSVLGARAARLGLIPA
jgi:DNA-binding NarL/FixJ family response regulator